MSNNRKRNRCSLLLSSVIVYMANKGNKLTMTYIGAEAYVVPPSLTIPSQQNHHKHKQRRLLSRSSTTTRQTQTKLFSTAPTAAVNGLAAQEHSHSTSLFNVGYDAKSIIKFYDQRPWEVGLRLNMLGLPLLGELLKLK